jgi:hypothetical protein
MVSTKGQEFPGIVGADGRFTIKTGAGEGAPEGEYMVRIDPEVSAAGSKGPAKKGLSGLPFPAKYADETTSDLKVTIKPGENNLEPIKLIPGAAGAKSTNGRASNKRD